MNQANVNGKIIEQPTIELLDKGYVKLKAITGTDLTSVNSARCSYNKESIWFSEQDKKLIKFLAKNGHTSVFRHAFVTFELYMPLMIARQHFKYIVGSDHSERTNDPFTAWNESSRRYVTEEPEFYVVQSDQWRSAPENSKQGSGEVLSERTGEFWTKLLKDTYLTGLNRYEGAMKAGICAEQARLFLPAYGLYVRWYWSASVQGVAHMLNQRLAKDSQKEFQEYARAVYEVMVAHFPVSIEELVKLAEEAGE